MFNFQGIKPKSCPSDATYTYNYDTETNGKGALASITGGPNSMTTSYKYDNLSRNYQVTEAFDGQTFSITYGFDSHSRVNKITYPSGFIVNQTYDDLSNNLISITDASNNSIWELAEINNLGIPSKSVLGADGEFEKEKELTDLMLPDFDNFTATFGSNNWSNKWEYSFDPTTGNMMSRQNELTQTGFSSITPRDLTETFDYDDLDRLYTVTQGSSIVMTIGVDDNGNITDKTGMGDYTYATSPAPGMPLHAPQTVGALSETLNQYQDIDYTPFNKIAQIKEGEATLLTDFTQLNYTYGLDNERRKMVEQKTVASDLVSTRTKYYSQNYEKEIISDGSNTETREINYIFAPDGLAAIYETKNNVNKMYYTSTDNLGSIYWFLVGLPKAKQLRTSYTEHSDLPYEVIENHKILQN